MSKGTVLLTHLFLFIHNRQIHEKARDIPAEKLYRIIDTMGCTQYNKLRPVTVDISEKVYKKPVSERTKIRSVQ